MVAVRNSMTPWSRKTYNPEVVGENTIAALKQFSTAMNRYGYPTISALYSSLSFFFAWQDVTLKHPPPDPSFSVSVLFSSSPFFFFSLSFFPWLWAAPSRVGQDRWSATSCVGGGHEEVLRFHLHHTITHPQRLLYLAEFQVITLLIDYFILFYLLSFVSYLPVQ